MTDLIEDYNFFVDLYACVTDSGYWSGFYPFSSPTWAGSKIPKKVRVRPIPENTALDSDYWAWWSFVDKKRPLKFIWATRMQVDMCFAYGSQVETDSGSGKIIRVRFTVLEANESNNADTQIPASK